MCALALEQCGGPPGPPLTVADAARARCDRLEDLLLLSRYEDAAASAVELVRELESAPDTEPFLQRALVAALQAHFYRGRQAEVEAHVERLGLHRLSTPTFLAWMLLLLESGQAPAARRHTEAYMRLLAQPAGPSHADSAQPCASCREGAAASPQACCPSTSGQAPREDAAAVPRGAALAASERDRVALARLYTQDILALGLGHQREALAWLSAPGPAGSGALSGGGAPGGGGSCTAETLKAALRGSAAAAAVTGARELLGGCAEEQAAVAQLVGELQQLASDASGAPPVAPAGEAPAGASSSGAQARRSRGEDAPTAAGRAAAAGPGPAGTSNHAAAPHPAASSSAGTAPANDRSGPQGASGSSSSGASSAGARGRAGAAGAAAASPAASAAAPPRPPLLACAAQMPGVLRALYAWWAAFGAALARLAAAASLRLTSAQAWLVCRAAAAAARLRRGASGCGGPRSGCGSGQARSQQQQQQQQQVMGRVAVVLGGASLVLLAGLAEAPYVKAALRGYVGWLVSVLREGLGMGLSLHPSPVAVARA